jgi:cyclopropane fatty-acyl-phospholipid synthase-like methyltransferase
MADLCWRMQAIVDRCELGSISPPIALMELLIEAEDESRVAAVLASSPSSSGAKAILALLEANVEGCSRVAAMLASGVDRPPTNATVEEGVAFCKHLFDWSVRQSEEASVALYSLGNPALLRAATQEIVDVLEAWGSVGRGKRALDIGCGIGRMEEALAYKLGEIDAIDVSNEMIAVARRRCAAFDNVRLSTCSGLDLRAFADDAFHLIFAIDSFPYLAQSGMALVDTHFAEVARLLRRDGEFIVLNFSYRDDSFADRRDVATLASAHGFAVLVDGDTPFSLWNGVAFRMRAAHR